MLAEVENSLFFNARFLKYSWTITRPLVFLIALTHTTFIDRGKTLVIEEM